MAQGLHLPISLSGNLSTCLILLSNAATVNAIVFRSGAFPGASLAKQTGWRCGCW